MNILLIGTGIPTKDMQGIGGAGTVVIKIAEIFAKTDKVYVIPWWSEKPTILRKNPVINGVEYIRRRISLKLIFFIFKFFLSGSFKTTMRYTRGLNKIKYSLLYIFDRAHIELTLKCFKIDIIHVHGIALDYLPYIDVSIDKKIPLVCTSHGLNSLNPDINLDFDKNFEVDILGRLSNTECVTITTVSTEVKKRCVDIFHIPQHKIKVVLNGVDQEKFKCVIKSKKELREQHFLPQDKVILLQVGTLSKRKNHIVVVNAIMEMDDKIKEKMLYLIVGSGEEMITLSNSVKEYGLKENVMFTGRVPDEKLVEMFQLSDFFILPSTSEGLALVFLEAMASGLPIITFKDLEGVGDIYDPECMEMISNRDVGSMIDAVKRAIERKWNREQIKEHSTLWKWNEVCEKYREIYGGLMKGRGAE